MRSFGRVHENEGFRSLEKWLRAAILVTYASISGGPELPGLPG